MKTSIVMLVLALSVCAVASAPPPQQPGQPAAQPPAAGTQAPSQKKEIKDPAEYNAYINAVQQTDPKQKAIALEGFMQQYANSVMKEDALELLLQTYQQLGDGAKLTDTANRLLSLNANNLSALGVLTFLKRQAAEAGGAAAPQNFAEAARLAQRGLQALQTAPKPEGMADTDWVKRKETLGGLFHGALGMAALQQKDFPSAQQNLLAAVKANPNNLADVYPLALAYLQAQPPDYLAGLWFIARATNLSPPNTPARQQIEKYGKGVYKKYHGGDDGWDQVVQKAATSPLPPAGFTIAAAPTPAELATKLVQTKSVKDMSFDDFQLILTSGNQQAAEQVWTAIKDKPIAFVGKLISATPNQLSVAATAEDIDANKADTTITMAAPIPAKLMPKVGGPDVQIQATPVSYTTQPFMITMNKGVLVGKPAAPATPPKKTGPTKRRTTPR